jgi:hypothetical protein
MFYLFYLSLETVSGGINLFVNLLLNKEISQRRGEGVYECTGCERTYNKADLVLKNNNIYWPKSYPENELCEDVNISLI